MALEDLITKHIAALDANTAALKALAAGGGKATAAAGTKPATDKKPAGPDFDAVKVLANKLMEAKGRPLAKKLIKDVGGAADLANVKPDKYAALVAAFEQAMAADATEEAGDEDEL